MQRTELAEKWKSVIENLNLEGLMLLDNLMGGIAEMEEHNINTTEERKQEIQLERARREEKRHEEEVEKYWKQKEELAEMVKSLPEESKKVLAAIDTVEKMELDDYALTIGTVCMIGQIYGKNYMDTCNEFYSFGFYQGMEYMKSTKEKEAGAMAQN
ncbi:MAG: hypothetical protein IJ420_12790 [Lachnospiraceae bacterium]|nr:hypothetical protein [Lachnospiraceae bacterium]MBQ9135475.1 hypothetical protein [Lachnospiraceae bacterium]